MKFDMHMHTTKSDGKCKVEELLLKCEEKNIKIVSITDHDSVEAYKMKELKEFDGIIIHGVEFTVDWKVSLHILAYNIDVFDEQIQSMCDRISQYRMQEFLAIIRKLKNLGISVSLSELRKKRVMNIDSLAQYLYEHNYGNSILEVKNKYLNKHSNIYIPKKGIDINEAIEAIHNAGGKAILAHPWRYSNDTKKVTSLILKMKDIGVDGVEVMSSEKDVDVTNYLINICKKYGLLYTGGGDFHGKPNEILGLENDAICECIKDNFIL